ncbi:MAG: S9 family peptidase [Gammaproteobacteria bacterium]|nr:S9 family peptidase [Gammaproteobacteria bacterium]
MTGLCGAAGLATAGCVVVVLAACVGISPGGRGGADDVRTHARLPSASEVASGLDTPGAGPLVYPATARVDVRDDYHGTIVADPYRWLEDLDSPEVRAWVGAENGFAEPLLAAIPQRSWIVRRLTELWRHEHYGLRSKPVPIEAGGRLFYAQGDGRQDQSVLYVADSPESPGRVLVDPNVLSPDATIALADFEPSPDGRVIAYALSDGGTDWQIWRFRRVADGRDLGDEIVRTRFWGLSWAHDGSGVYYSRYGERPDGRGDDTSQPKIYFHRLGTPQGRDRLVYEVRGHPTRVPRAEVSDDGRWLVVTLYDGGFRNGVDLIDLQAAAAAPTTLFGAWDALYAFVGAAGDELFFSTTRDAPLGRVIAVDARYPEPARWRTVVPQSDVALEEANYVGGRLIVRYTKDARALARLYGRDGRPLGEVPAPGAGQLAGFAGRGDQPETFFTYTDYLTPTALYRYDVRSNYSQLYRRPDLAASTDAYVTERIFYASKDGTRVPMSITHRRDMPRDGNRPVLLYGYGGFAIPLLPEFRPQVLAWLEMGGVYAEANLRGGGEYGEAWHEAGVLARRQNVFDDFIAAAEYLIREGYTRPARLAIHGRSNGGLLVGAALTQRPALFGVALPVVGVLDVLRYHRGNANARQWSTEYGLSENPADFRAQYAYSPLHNVRDGACYPPTLVTTADHDDRVAPWHSYKFAAALQHAQACPRPILIRVETRPGHGAGKPRSMQIEDFADQWAFAAQQLGMRVPE